MDDRKLLKQISDKLGALLALSLLKDSENLNTADKLEILLRFDLSNQEIADILGTTKMTVEVSKSRILKVRRKNGKFTKS